MYRCRLCALQQIVQLILFEFLQLSLQFVLKSTGENPHDLQQPQGVTHVVKFETGVGGRKLFLDLLRNLRLFLNLLHSLVNLVKCAGHSCKRTRPGRSNEGTYRPPWMCLRASAAFFIAAIVSWFIFADSSVFTFISS